ncbi:MAG: hypothetical protein KGJ86_04115 [Chloroflexota bacterium]|nr:hypothetical protein [Chloroflexota bacterium]
MNSYLPKMWSLLLSRARYAAFAYLAGGVVVATSATTVLLTTPAVQEVRTNIGAEVQSVGQALASSALLPHVVAPAPQPSRASAPVSLPNPVAVAAPAVVVPAIAKPLPSAAPIVSATPSSPAAAVPSPEPSAPAPTANAQPPSSAPPSTAPAPPPAAQPAASPSPDANNLQEIRSHFRSTFAASVIDISSGQGKSLRSVVEKVDQQPEALMSPAPKPSAPSSSAPSPLSPASAVQSLKPLQPPITVGSARQEAAAQVSAALERASQAKSMVKAAARYR